jgi:hypothetical protein
VRNFVLTVTATLTTLQAFDDLSEQDVPRWEVSFDDVNLATLGDSVRIALRQQSVDGGDDAIGLFDSVYAAVTRDDTMPGDFNGDGVLTALDIDQLSAAVRGAADPAEFDLNGDAQVDQTDRQYWVDDLKRTWFGDANLDGEFNSSDFVDVFQMGHYEDNLPLNSGWAEGDWNGDADFDTSDFVTAFQAGGFEQGPRAAVSAVPEPNCWIVGMPSGLLLVAARRRR